MAFTDELWSRIENTVYPAILAHPFLKGLTSGKLSEAAFRHYVVQDALYLKDFGRGLALLAARSAEEDDLVMFSTHAGVTVAVEKALHESFLGAWDLSAEDVAATEPAPNCLLYTSYLLRVAYTRPYAEALGAFLPCYWIYWEVGKALVGQGSPHPLFQRWIDTYAGDEFAESVRGMLGAVNRACESLTSEQREAVAVHFERASRMEYLFWDMGYREQVFPV